MNEETFLAAIVENPEEPTTWLALADWLEEQDNPRGELLRLTQALLQPDCEQRAEREERMRFLLGQGVRPCWPTRTNALGMKFAWCPPGTFLMGSPRNEKGHDDNERQHRVTLTKGFWLGVTPVTQAQWQAVTGYNPIHCSWKGADRPVEAMSWDDCRELCKRLAERDGRNYRLPTEAEWEYACRAGTTTPFHFGATISTDQANYGREALSGTTSDLREGTTPVGSFPANAWGLCDVHGNVWEWCQDWCGPSPQGEVNDPQGSKSGDARVLRGGSWFSQPQYCRSAFRCGREAANQGDVGCRVVLCLD
jgi:formylglycine-generating enzyme